MNNKVKTIIEKIKTKYSNADTILVFGSATTPDWAPDSDIDIFVIDSNSNDEREDIVIDGVIVEIQKDNFSNIRKDIENERGNLHHRNVATMIDSSEIISSKSLPEIQNLKDLARNILNSKTTYTDEDIKMWLYSIEDYLSKAKKDLSRNDEIAFYLDTYYVLKNVIEMSLATNSLYLPQPKNLANLLQKADPKFYQIFRSFATETDPAKKLKILEQLLP